MRGVAGAGDDVVGDRWVVLGDGGGEGGVFSVAFAGDPEERARPGAQEVVGGRHGAGAVAAEGSGPTAGIMLRAALAAFRAPRFGEAVVPREERLGLPLIEERGGGQRFQAVGEGVVADAAGLAGGGVGNPRRTTDKHDAGKVIGVAGHPAQRDAGALRIAAQPQLGRVVFRPSGGQQVVEGVEQWLPGAETGRTAGMAAGGLAMAGEVGGEPNRIIRGRGVAEGRKVETVAGKAVQGEGQQSGRCVPARCEVVGVKVQRGSLVRGPWSVRRLQAGRPGRGRRASGMPLRYPRGAFPESLPLVAVDDHLVVVDKPWGLLTHRGDQGRDARTVVQIVRDQLGGGWVYPLHRLDRPTSGLLLLARSPEAAKAYQAAMTAPTARKLYLAVVRGWIEQAGVEASDLVDPDTQQAQEAVTHYTPLARTEIPVALGPHATSRYALVAAAPRTGRWHQVRRHLRRLKHPLIGDTTHGDAAHNRHFRTAYQVERCLLHAHRWELDDPLTGERRRFMAPLPADFRRVCTAFGWPIAAEFPEPQET